MKRIFAALLALSMLLLAGCAKPSEAEPAPTEEPVPLVEPAAPAEAPETEDPVIYSCDGLKIPIPAEDMDLLIPELRPEAWNAHWTPLISLWHKASVEAFNADNPDADDEGFGWLGSVSRLDRIGFEDWLSGDRTGASLFAKDDEENYYVMAYPTDVRLYGADDGSWGALTDWVAALPQQIIDCNGLTAYDASDLLTADHTYGGEHVELGCRFPGEPMDLCILSLSQPAKQGAGGVWCVERIQYIYSDYSFTDLELVFPVAFGFDETAADYYARLQAECDAGEHPELLTARGAALDYARRAAWLFGEDVSETDFELIEAVG